MQTFLPYADFHRSAEVLDRQRLGKQRLETLQILRTLTGVSDGWKNHPAVKMWRGYERALLFYGYCICEAWKERGYIDNQYVAMLSTPVGDYLSRHDPLPPWVGCERFHAAHRSNLLRKNPEWYGQYGWKESADLEYVWPVS